MNDLVSDLTQGCYGLSLCPLMILSADLSCRMFTTALCCVLWWAINESADVEEVALSDELAC